MSSWTKSHQRKIESEKSARLKRLLWTPLTFLAGVTFTLVLNQWVVPLLPGPHAEVLVRGIRVIRGSFAGCTGYTFILSTDEAVNSAYIKIVFPQNIKGLKVGYPSEGVFSKSEWMQTQVWDMGRNSGGECDVIQAAVNINEGVSSIAVSNVLTVRTSKLAPNASVMGAAAVSTYDSVLKFNQPMFEGDYDYSKWGLTVRRKLRFQYQGVADAK